MRLRECYETKPQACTMDRGVVIYIGFSEITSGKIVVKLVALLGHSGPISVSNNCDLIPIKSDLFDSSYAIRDGCLQKKSQWVPGSSASCTVQWN